MVDVVIHELQEAYMSIEIANTVGDGQTMAVAHLPSPIEDIHLGDINGARNRNQQRALFSGVALKAYAARTGGLTSEPIEAIVGDLLADLRHLCDSLGLTFWGIDEQAHRRYTEEISGEG